jgi:hypothetical protein
MVQKYVDLATELVVGMEDPFCESSFQRQPMITESGILANSNWNGKGQKWGTVSCRRHAARAALKAPRASR